MISKTHDEQIERWAKFVKENPQSWKKEHTEFINAQFEKSWGFYEKLGKLPDGQKKIKELRMIS
jgi:hypothetical protein